MINKFFEHEQMISTILEFELKHSLNFEYYFISRANKRYQRRARLDFGTKLGMNSPF